MLFVKKVISLGFVLSYIGIAIMGCYYLNKQIATATNGFHEPETKLSGIMKNSDFVLVKQTESEPLFYVVDSTGAIIDTKSGIKAGTANALKVLAGSTFEIREMEVIISKGSERIATIMASGNTINLPGLVTRGYRIVIIIKRVLKTTPNGVHEVAFKNGTIKIPIL